MAKPQSTIGAKLSISAGVPATEDATGCAALTWSRVGRIENIGERPEEFATDDVQDLETGNTTQVKTFKNVTAFDVSLVADEDDAGQTLMETAFNSFSGTYRLKLEHTSGKIQYFNGRVNTFTPSALDGKASRLACNISLDLWADGSKYITVAA
jgi:hypothetical protein